MIGHAFRKRPTKPALRQAIAETDADNLAFVVVNGIKSADEPCSDKLYEHAGKALSQRRRTELIVSLAGKRLGRVQAQQRPIGRHGAPEPVARIYFSADEFSFGATRIPLIRQSTTPKFRSYAENARWEIGDIMFATINLPAPTTIT